MKTDFFKNRKLWLTGASSGIGQACAIEFARRGAQLAISGRDVTALSLVKSSILQENPQATVIIVPFDVTDKKAYPAVIDAINTQLGGVDTAFFNAGISQLVDVKQFTSAPFEQIMAVNYFGMVYGIEAVLPLLRASKTAQLVGMASIAAYGGLPMGQAYSASKAAVRNLLQGLAIDLRKQHIAVSIVCPGFIDTRLIRKNNFYMPLLMTPTQAAVIIADGIANKRYEIHFPKSLSVLFKVVTSLPGWLYVRLMAHTRHRAR